MEVIKGSATLNQIAYGRLYFLKRDEGEPMWHSRLSPLEEQARFFHAQHQAMLQVLRFYEQAMEEVGIETASIFTMHRVLLDDIDFVDKVLEELRKEHTTAEYAVYKVGKYFVDTFSQIDNPYMKARAVDVKDVCRRILNLLQNRPKNAPLRDGPAILVANELMPSEVMELDRDNLLGVVACKDRLDSHSAMLLRAYEIPAIAEVELDSDWNGHMALIDGIGQRLYLEPEEDVLEKLREQYEKLGAAGEAAVV